MIPHAKHDATKASLNNKEEEHLLFSHIDKDTFVFEYGSGMSTHHIAQSAKAVISVEHNIDYYNEVMVNLPSNANVLYIPRNAQEGAGEDGTYEQYKDYVDSIRKFDLSGEKKLVVFIDGRARPYCAMAVKEHCPHATVFVHDYRNPNPIYDRPEYHCIEQFMKLEDHVFALAKFTCPNE